MARRVINIVNHLFSVHLVYTEMKGHIVDIRKDGG